jgi:hypothetical protein
LLQIPAADENGAVAFSQWWVSLVSINFVFDEGSTLQSSTTPRKWIPTTPTIG